MPQQREGLAGTPRGAGARGGEEHSWVRPPGLRDDLGPVNASFPNKTGATANPPPFCDLWLEVKAGSRGDCYRFCPRGGTSFLPSALCLGKVPKCLWGES